ncbi:hypothetical protein DYH09_03080 [bacterium CPR1]|nr:hypothetical protein [bacterium CPR1]
MQVGPILGMVRWGAVRSSSAPAPGSDCVPQDTLSTRTTAHRLFARPEVRECWSVSLGAPVEFPVVPCEGGILAVLREPKTTVEHPGVQRLVRLFPGQEPQALPTPEGRFLAAGRDGIELSWTTTGKYIFDPMMPSVDHKHDEVKVQAANWSRSLRGCTNTTASPFPWPPISWHGRTLLQVDERTIECLDGNGRKLFQHQGTPWAKLQVPPALSRDGRAVICDDNHGVLTAYRSDGSQAWQETTFRTIRCTPLLLDEGHTLVAIRGEESGTTTLRRMDDAGKTVSQWTVPGAFVAGLAQAPDGTILVAANDPPRLAGYDTVGQLRWEHPLSEPSLGPPNPLEDGSVLIVGRDGRVCAVQVTDPRTGHDPLAAQETAGAIHEGSRFVTLAGVRVRRK